MFPRSNNLLDEPTTGLRFDDVRKLLDVLQRLVELGNTVLVWLFFTRLTCLGVPAATTRPPYSPPSGPRSALAKALHG